MAINSTGGPRIATRYSHHSHNRSGENRPQPRPENFVRAARHRPKPRSGPRCHDTDHHLIAAPACRRTLLPPLHRCRLDASEGTCDAVGHAKIITSTAAATTNSRLGSSIRRHRLWPAYPLPKPPPRQIPIDRRLSTQPPRVPSWEAFGRRPSERVDRSRRAGIRNPSPPRAIRCWSGIGCSRLCHRSGPAIIANSTGS